MAIAGNDVLRELEPLGLQHVLPIVYSDYLTTDTDLPVPGFLRTPGARDWMDALAENLAPGPHLAVPDDLAVMPYTSGTTGKPKGCMHTHRSVMHTTIAGNVWFRTTPDITYLGVLPYFHVTGMQNSMNGPIYMGSTVVLLPRWDREVAGELIKRYRVQAWTLIPTMVVDLLASPNAASFDLSSVRRMTGGGAARMIARASSGAASGSGISRGVALRGRVSVGPMRNPSGRRESAGPSAMNCPRSRSRKASACRRSMPRRSAARAMSISRKVRPMKKLDASAATFLASFASRCVAMTPAIPRLRPRHMRLVMAPSEGFRASSATSPAAAGAKSCASSTT